MTMANDWIPVRPNLRTHPKVLRVAKQTGRSPEEVVGLLIALWGWISGVSLDGKVDGVKVEELVFAVGANIDFWIAIEEIKWLKIKLRPVGIEIPEYEIWLSKGAKRRMADARRKQEARTHNIDGKTYQVQKSKLCPQNVQDLSAKCPHKRGPQNRTEENIITPPPPAYADGDPEGGGFASQTEEELWELAAELIPIHQPGVRNAGAYVASCRSKGQKPLEAFPWLAQELAPKPQAKLCEGTCNLPLERISHKTGSRLCFACEQRAEEKRNPPMQWPPAKPKQKKNSVKDIQKSTSIEIGLESEQNQNL